MGKKYIEAEDLMRRMYERAFETDGDTMWQSGCWVRYRAIEAVVKETPAADVVEVVRCADCKYQDKGENDCEAWNLCGYRPWLHIPTEDDAFCSKGERKDG